MKKDNYIIPYTIITTVGRLFFHMCYHPTVIGVHHIPLSDAVIFCGNHRHKLDPACIIYSTRRIIHFMAKKEFMNGKDALTAKSNPLLRWLTSLLLKCCGCISVDREGSSTSALKSALTYLRDGSALGIFPEGMRNKTNDELLPFKLGAVSMARKTNAWLVPVGIVGTFSKGGNLTIRFGEPFKIEELSLEEANHELRNKILKLIRENENEVPK